MAILKCRGLWSVSVATLVAFGASATWASDQTGHISDPEVISNKRFSDDVSAFYLGLTAGYGGGGDDRFGLTTPTDTFAIGDQDISGIYGGVRGGWRGVLPARGGRDYVYGFELGYDFGSLDDSVSTVVGSETVQGGSEVSDIVTLRFRNGLTNRSGRILYFVSVGYLWGDVETTNSISSSTGTQSFEASDRRNGFLAQHWCGTLSDGRLVDHR